MERIISSVTSVSWIPYAAATDPTRSPVDHRLGLHDDPPPERIDDIDALLAGNRFRFVNVLRAYIDVEEGEVRAHGHLGGGLAGASTRRLGPITVTFAALAFDEIRTDPEFGDGWVRFRQTAGGQIGASRPRRMRAPPYVRMAAPSSWTTLDLTIHTDGRSEFAVVGASRFPRHWFYDAGGELVAKSGLVDPAAWADQVGASTPWGESDTPAMVTAVESALEREISRTIMRASSEPRIIELTAGEVLVEQGEESTELYVLLDGVLDVEVDGDHLAELGPGAIVGEKAILEGGRRTATLIARTACELAVASADQVDRTHLEALALGRRRPADPDATVDAD